MVFSKKSTTLRRDSMPIRWVFCKMSYSSYWQWLRGHAGMPCRHHWCLRTEVAPYLYHDTCLCTCFMYFSTLGTKVVILCNFMHHGCICLFFQFAQRIMGIFFAWYSPIKPSWRWCKIKIMAWCFIVFYYGSPSILASNWISTSRHIVINEMID